MSSKSHATDRQSPQAPYGQQRQPQRQIENTEEVGFEKSEDSPIDDPGDAQRSSKTDLDGDGEEEMR